MKRYLVFGAVAAALGMLAAPALAQPAFVQGTTSSESGTSLTQSYATDVAPADLLVAMVRTAGITSVSDNRDGNWTETQSSPDGVNSMWYYQDAEGGATTVALTGSSSGAMRLVLAEYSGIVRTSALDGESCNTSTGATASTGTADGSAAGDLAVAGVGAYSSGITVDAGPDSTLRDHLTGSNGTSAEEDVSQTANPDQAQSFALSPAPSAGQTACEALFKSASGPSALVSTASPSISGTDVQGDTLTATPGTWTGSPASYTYQWQDCSNGSCANINGATLRGYQLQSSDVGDTVDVVVTATGSYGSTSATSAETSTIQAGGVGKVATLTFVHPVDSSTGDFPSLYGSCVTYDDSLHVTFELTSSCNPEGSGNFRTDMCSSPNCDNSAGGDSNAFLYEADENTCTSVPIDVVNVPLSSDFEGPQFAEEKYYASAYAAWEMALNSYYTNESAWQFEIDFANFDNTEPVWTATVTPGEHTVSICTNNSPSSSGEVYGIYLDGVLQTLNHGPDSGRTSLSGFAVLDNSTADPLDINDYTDGTPVPNELIHGAPLVETNDTNSPPEPTGGWTGW